MPFKQNNLDSKCKIPKFLNMTIKDCIDKHHTTFFVIIHKNAEWYTQEVFQYLEEQNKTHLKNKQNEL